MDTRKRLAELLKLNRNRWSNADLARELGEHPHWVRDRVSGRIQIKADELPRIAKALNVSPCAFFEEHKLTGAERVYQAVVTILKDEGIIPPPERPPLRHLTDDEVRRIFETLPEDQQQLVREIGRRRRELREREIPPEEDEL